MDLKGDRACEWEHVHAHVNVCVRACVYTDACVSGFLETCKYEYICVYIIHVFVSISSLTPQISFGIW